MVQIIQEKRNPSLSERFSRALGVGLEGAQNLMQQHEQKKLAAQSNQEIAKKFGIDLSGITNPEERKLLLQDALQGRSSQELETKKQLGQQLLEQQKQEGKQGLLQGKQDFLGKIFGGSQPQKNEMSNQLTSGSPEQQMQKNNESGMSTGFDPSQLSDADIAQATALDPNLGRILQSQKDVSLREKREEEKGKIQQKIAEEKIDYQSFKDNKDYTEKVLSGYESYKRDKAVLSQMASIAKKEGSLPAPMTVSFLNKIGIPLGVLQNPDAEQFDKLSQELMRGISGVYGSRILQSEVQNFMRSIPTLLNSPEGRKRVIDQWNILNEGKKIYYDAYKDVRKQNPKRLPVDLHEQVIEHAEDKLDLLANEFKNLNEPSFIKMKGPDGKIRNVPREMMDQALEAGGELL